MPSRPTSAQMGKFQAHYVSLCPDDIIDFLEKQSMEYLDFLDNLDDSRLDYRYEDGKWSLREVLIHINDTETIFNYRCLAILRGEPKPLNGFNQDDYIQSADLQHLDKSYIKYSFRYTRLYTLRLYGGMRDPDWEKCGTISDYTMCLNAMPFMVGGHLQHHMNIIKERYLD